MRSAFRCRDAELAAVGQGDVVSADHAAGGRDAHDLAEAELLEPVREDLGVAEGALVDQDDDGASAAVCAQAAFRYADAFLECAGKQDKRVEHAEQRAQEAETKFEVLQSIHVNMGEDFAARVALTEV